LCALAAQAAAAEGIVSRRDAAAPRRYATHAAMPPMPHAAPLQREPPLLPRASRQRAAFF